MSVSFPPLHFFPAILFKAPIDWKCIHEQSILLPKNKSHNCKKILMAHGTHLYETLKIWFPFGLKKMSLNKVFKDFRNNFLYAKFLMSCWSDFLENINDFSVILSEYLTATERHPQTLVKLRLVAARFSAGEKELCYVRCI